MESSEPLTPKSIWKTTARMLNSSEADTSVARVSYVPGVSLASRRMIQIVCPLLLVCGTFGNVMTIAVVGRLQLQPGLGVCFTALAVVDLLVLYVGILLSMWLPVQFDFILERLHPAFCELTPYVVCVGSAIPSWFLVLMTCNRTLGVVCSHRSRVLFTRRYSLLATCMITALLLLLYSHNLYGYTSIRSYDGRSFLCTVRNGSYFIFAKNVWSWVDLVISSFAPFVLVFACNIVLLRTVLMSVKNARQRLATNQSQPLSARKRQASSMTVVLMSVSIAFVVFTAPIRVYSIVSTLLTAKSNDTAVASSSYSSLTLLHESNDTDMALSLYIAFSLWHGCNSAFNFYVYCLTGDKFKSEFLKVMCIAKQNKVFNVCRNAKHCSKSIKV